MSPMPAPPSSPFLPYHIYVTAVNNSAGSPVSGAQFTLKNTTKATQTIKTSIETNSNITINVADCGAWDDGDNLQLDVIYGSANKTVTTTIDQTGNPDGRDLGIIMLLIELVGTTDCVSSASGGICAIYKIISSTDGVSVVGGSIKQSQKVIGSIEGVTTFDGGISTTYVMIGSADAVSGAVSTLKLMSKIGGDANGETLVQGVLSVDLGVIVINTSTVSITPKRTIAHL